MHRYKVTYKEGSEIKIGALVAANEAKALKVFSFKFPGIPVENIISLSEAQKNERIDVSNVPKTESSPNTGSSYNEPTTSASTINSINGDEYKASIVVAKIVSFSGWAICLVALILVLTAIGNMGQMGMLAIVPAFGIFIGGLLLVVAGQITRSTMENTNYSREMLKIMQNRNS